MPNMVYRGAWDYCTEFRPGDCVIHSGVVYIALKQSAGSAPDDPGSAAFWQSFTAPGSSGSQDKHNKLLEIQGGSEFERHHLTESAAKAAENAANPGEANPFATRKDLITEHNKMDGLQGGQDGERFHVRENVSAGLSHAVGPGAANPFLTRADVAPLTKDIANFRRALTPAGIGTLYGAAYGNGIFIAVGDNTGIAAPEKPHVWKSEAVPAGGYRGVVYGQDKFVAVGLKGKGMWRDDQRGGTWNPVTLPNLDWNRVAFGNGKYVAVTDGAVAASADGVTGWQKVTVSQGYGNDIAFDNGVFIIVGKAGAMTSVDGAAWTPHSLDAPGGANPTWRAVAARDGQIVILGGKCAVTTDLFATLAEYPTPVGGWDAAVHGGEFILAAGGAACMSARSLAIDGLKADWLQRESLNYAVLGLTFGAGFFVLAGDGILTAGLVDAAEAFQSANAPNKENPFVTEADLAPLTEAQTWRRIG